MQKHGVRGLVGGDFATVDFAAAAPYTYNHETGGGAYNDGTIGKSEDVTESLEGGDFACNDIVTFLVQIVMKDTTVDTVQTAQFDFRFTADSTGQSGAAISAIEGVSMNYGQVENGGGGGAGSFGLDSGISDDGGSEVTLISSSLTGPLFGNDPGGQDSELFATVEVTDLEAGEKVVLRIDTRLSCQPNSDPTGNLQALLDEGRVVPSQDIINTGAQTIPFKQIGNIAGAGEPLLSIEKKVVEGANGACADSVDQLDNVLAGSTVTYCYFISNLGTQALFDVELVDDMGTEADTSDDVTVTSCTGLTNLDGQTDALDLASGATATCTLTVVIQEDTTNIATATGNNGLTGGNFEELQDSDDATVTVVVPLALEVTKTAGGGYRRTVSWTLEKSVAPATLSGLANSNVGPVTWTVTATKDESYDAYVVTGDVNITNPNDSLTLTVTSIIDSLTGGDLLLNCGASFSATLAPLASTVCEYTAPLTFQGEPSSAPQGNTVTVTGQVETVQLVTTDTASIAYTESELVGDDSVTVDDNRCDGNALCPSNSVVSTTTTFTYNEDFSCSSDPGDYENGVLTTTYTNTATAKSTNVDLSDSESVGVTCYAPVISKDVTAEYDKLYDWAIGKSVTGPTGGPFCPGDEPSWTWTVDVTKSFVVNVGFNVRGSIYVTNPSPTSSMTVQLVDVLLGDSTTVTVDCSGAGSTATVPPGDTTTCTYQASPSDSTAVWHVSK